MVKKVALATIDDLSVVIEEMKKRAQQEELDDLRRRFEKAGPYVTEEEAQAMIPHLSWQSIMLRNLLTALLGAVLALFALWCLNPAIFARGTTITFQLPKIGLQGDHADNTRLPVANVKPEVSASTPDPYVMQNVPEDSADFARKYDSPFSSISVVPAHLTAMVKPGTKNCWMRVTTRFPSGLLGKILAEDLYSATTRMDTVSRAGWSGSESLVQVRSGCPGRVEYYVDGNQRYPENRSGTPDKSEVVTLP